MPLDVVTGAFSYTGSFIAEELLARGRQVRSLSRADAPAGHPLRGRVDRSLLQFADRAALARALAGAETFYNTYWIRFPHGGHGFEQAVENSTVLFDAAREAGVGRIVHVSVSNPSGSSPYGYFRGKHAVEQRLASAGISHAIVRPTLIFGGRQEIRSTTSRRRCGGFPCIRCRTAADTRCGPCRCATTPASRRRPAHATRRR